MTCYRAAVFRASCAAPRIAASEEPRLHNGFVWPEELETRREGILPVQIFSVADMVVNIRHELRLDVRQHHFPHGKVDRDVVPRPDGPLGTNGTVRTTANPKALPLNSFHHGHGQHTRWVTDFQGTIDIKTDQDHDVEAFLVHDHRTSAVIGAGAIAPSPRGRGDIRGGQSPS